MMISLNDPPRSPIARPDFMTSPGTPHRVSETAIPTVSTSSSRTRLLLSPKVPAGNPNPAGTRGAF